VHAESARVGTLRVHPQVKAMVGVKGKTIPVAELVVAGGQAHQPCDLTPWRGMGLIQRYTM